MSMLKFFRIPFATSGDKIAVPDASQPSGSVSYTDGFGVDYELDPGVDPAAKDVPRDESNQLYFDITNAIKELQSFGTPDFITAVLNGGVAFSYSKYARVLYSDGNVYISKKNANTSLPTVAADWLKATDNADYLTIATTAFEASVADGKAVYWDSANSRFDEAVADGTTKQNFIGFADVTNGRVFVYGLMSGLLSGLAGNTVYYLSAVTPGALTTVLPTSNIVRVGVTKSATDMFVAGVPQANPTVQATVSGSFSKLIGSAPGTSAVVTYTANEIVTGDGAGSYLSTRAWNKTITMTTAGLGGLDIGVVAASTFYYAYAITKDDGTQGVVASLSATSPTLPATYTKWARIGSFRTDGTANKYPLSFQQSGKSISYKVTAGSNVAAMPQMSSGIQGNVNTPTWVAVSVSTFVPPTAGKIVVTGATGSGLSNGQWSVAPNNSYGSMQSSTNPAPSGGGSGAGGIYTFLLSQCSLILESTNIYFACSIATGGLYCNGYEDNL